MEIQNKILLIKLVNWKVLKDLQPKIEPKKPPKGWLDGQRFLIKEHVSN